MSLIHKNGPSFYILPLLLAAFGLAVGYFYGRGGDSDRRTHPGE
jgi:hypothetical protein